jgi:bifunctional ADP-heptose synthase (sugar kinase/adenylyltransferase)
MDYPRPKPLKILIIGEECLDLYRFGNCERLSAEAPVPIMLQTRMETKAGMAANVARNIESLGHQTHTVSNGSQIVKERFICSTVANVSQQILRVDSNDKCESLDIVQLENVLKTKSTFDASIISDYNKGFLPSSLLKMIIPILPKPIFVDSKKNDLSVFDECIIKINKLETDSTFTFPKNCELITTLGENGAMWREKTYPAKKIQDVFDVCGAGDSFLAALAVKYIQTSNMEEAIKFANLCAGISVRHLGVYNVTTIDIESSSK